jgi:hypothetical protein
VRTVFVILILTQEADCPSIEGAAADLFVWKGTHHPW